MPDSLLSYALQIGRGLFRPPPRPPGVRRLALLQIGSTSVDLVLADVSPAAPPRRLLDDTKVTRLAAGLDATGALSRPAMSRTLQAMDGFVEDVHDLAADGFMVIATEAVRVATNQAEFLAQAQRMGLSVRVVSAEEQARLVWRAALELPQNTSCRSVLDIGGGSVQLSVGSASGCTSSSVPLGCERLTFRFLHHDPPLAAERRQLQDFVRAGCDAGLPAPQGELLVTGAVARTLARWHSRSRSDELQGALLPSSFLEDAVQQIGTMDVSARHRVAPDRAPSLYAGAVVLQVIAKRAAASAVILSQDGSAWGALLEFADRALAPPPSP